MKAHRLIFTVALVAFLASNFPLGFVGVYARLPMIVLLVGTCIFAVGRTRLGTISPIFATVYLFLTYSFVTTFWTENIWLSLAKWILYAVVALAFLVAGTASAQSTAPDSNPFDPLKWLFLPMMISSIIAFVAGIGWIEGNFSGACGNSNSLGASLMLTSPWLVYELNRSWGNRRRRRWLVALAGATVVIMVATHSRAATFSFLLIPFFAAKQMKVGRKVSLAYGFLMLLIVLYAVRPETFDFIYRSYVKKRSDDMMSSRGMQMQDSWDAARQGGVFGTGFGVSVGISQYWDYTTFSRTAREKGNSMLAIVEETGLIGLGFYTAVLCAMYFAIRRCSQTSDPDQRFIANIAMGYFVASLVHGQFEAWFLSFGPDVSVYWGVVGMALGGMTRKIDYERNTRMEAAPGTRVLSPATITRG